MADIQILNGLAVLITGLALLPQRLSALHWKMIVYLAWFSFIANISALTFLRSYLIHHPFERVWRLGSTFVLLLILTVALVPTGHFSWDSDARYYNNYIEDAAPSAYAICHFNTNFTDSRTYFYERRVQGKNSMLFSILLIVFGYTVRVFKLYRYGGHAGSESFSVSAVLVERCLKSAAMLQRLIGSASFLEIAASNMIVASHFVVCVWIDIYSSMASDVRFSVPSANKSYRG